MSRTTRSAIAARSAAASRMPIRRPRCRASRSPATREIAVVGKAGARTIAAGDFFLGRADDGARARRDHRRGAAAGVAGRAALGLSGIRAPARRFRAGGRAVFYDPDASGQAANAHVGVIGVGDPPLRLPERRSGAQRPDDRRGDDRQGGAKRRRPRSIRSDDIHASAAYRRALVGTMVERALKSAARQSQLTRAMSVRFEVNGKSVEVDVEPRTDARRLPAPQLRLTGTHVGCEHGVCGACTVHRRRRRGALLPDARGAGRRQQGRDGRGPVATTPTSRRCRRRSASITRCNAASARRA